MLSLPNSIDYNLQIIHGDMCVPYSVWPWKLPNKHLDLIKSWISSYSTFNVFVGYLDDTKSHQIGHVSKHGSLWSYMPNHVRFRVAWVGQWSSVQCVPGHSSRGKVCSISILMVSFPPSSVRRKAEVEEACLSLLLFRLCKFSKK